MSPHVETVVITSDNDDDVTNGDDSLPFHLILQRLRYFKFILCSLPSKYLSMVKLCELNVCIIRLDVTPQDCSTYHNTPSSHHNAPSSHHNALL